MAFAKMQEANRPRHVGCFVREAARKKLIELLLEGGA